MDTDQILNSIQQQLADLRKAFESSPFPKTISDKWLPRNRVMEFLNYGPTQMATLEKNDLIVVAKVGKRKFILKESLEKMIEKNIISANK